MHDLMIAKIDELMQREIEFETLDESCQREYILDALKSCLSHANSMYDSTVTDKNQPSHYRIAVQQTLYTFAVLQDESGLADTSQTFGLTLTQLLKELQEMTCKANTEKSPATMREAFFASQFDTYAEG